MPTSPRLATICCSSSIRKVSRPWRPPCNCSERAMSWRIEIVLFLLLYATLATAHEPVLLDARRATPGLRLELTELPSITTQASAIPRYRLQASGLPHGVVFGVWAKDFGHAFHQVVS